MSTLHKALGIPADQPIPAERIRDASHSRDPELRTLGTLARGLRTKAAAPKPKES